MQKLKNKVAVITGGNSGIGLEAAKEFALQGAKVAIMGRNQESINESLKVIGHGAIGVQGDVSKTENLQILFETVLSHFGKIDVLVANAGIYKTAALEDCTEILYDEIMDINLKGTFFTVQKALPFLNNSASVILTSSTVNEMGLSKGSVYAASKAAVRSLARSFSAELIGRGIRVNVLTPGPIATPLFYRTGTAKEKVEENMERMATNSPSKRLGTVEEMAKGLLYLASDDSSYMVGSELVLDGGFKSL
ncbi:MAG: SDR family oxidoreductase [Flavobacteriales bacterium]